MKKNQVNTILKEQAERRKHIFIYLVIIISISAVATFFLTTYYNRSKNYYVHYDEKSKIDYKVFLKDNNFFNDDHLGTDNKYIASLIKHIDANFNYQLAMEDKKVDYVYTYWIDATVNVKESEQSKPLYNFKETIIDKQEKFGTWKFDINEDVYIDYNKYNDLINEFISVYDLEKIDSTLTINMHINVKGSCDDFEIDSNNESVISLVIPLTTKTVGIDLKDNLINANDNIMPCKNPYVNNYILLILAIIALVLDTIYIIIFINYLVKSRTAKSIYNTELKKILNNYHSYLQKVSNKIDVNSKSGLQIDNKLAYKDCQFYKLETFTDLLEIRDNLDAPIIMSSNAENTATYFMVLNIDNKAVYIYGLRINDIEKKLKAK